MIIECRKCGAKSRLPDPPDPAKRYRCGKCKSILTLSTSEDTQSRHLRECITYLEKEIRLQAFQDKEATFYSNAVVKYGKSASVDSYAAQEMCRAANRLAASAIELLKRRGELVSIPDAALANASAWELAYMDYSAATQTLAASFEAMATGMMPDTKRVKALHSQSEKSRRKAEGEQKKFMKYLGKLKLNPDEGYKLLANASRAIAAEDWQPVDSPKANEQKIREMDEQPKASQSKEKVSRSELAEMLLMMLAAALGSEAIKWHAEYLSYEIHSDSDLDALFGALFGMEMWLIIHACELAILDVEKRNECLDSFHRRAYEMLQEDMELDFDGWLKSMGLVYARYSAAWSTGVNEGDVLKTFSGVANVFYESLFGEAKSNIFNKTLIGGYVVRTLQSHEDLIWEYDIE